MRTILDQFVLEIITMCLKLVNDISDLFLIHQRELL